jgi:hypothetical protein
MKKKSRRKTITFFWVILAVSLFSGSPKIGAAADLLRLDPGSHRYFIDSAGKPVYLTGSHTWDNLQQIDTFYPSQSDFDYDDHLSWLQSKNHNFIRLWMFESTQWFKGGSVQHSIYPHPWARTGPGTAADGLPKFDLTKLNQAYFDELRSRVGRAQSKGIYVAVMLFQGIASTDRNLEFAFHPFNISNNINNIDIDRNDDGLGYEFHTLGNATIAGMQETYIKKTIDTLNGFDTVLWEVGNEIGPYSTEWQYHVINFIKNYEKTLPKQHPVGMTYQYLYPTGVKDRKVETNTNLFNSPADWVSPVNLPGVAGHDYLENPPIDTRGKVIVPDSDHLGSNDVTPVWVWKSFLRGLNPIHMDCYRTWRGMNDPTIFEGLRLAMGATLAYSQRLDLSNMLPSDNTSSCSTRYCLVNPGAEYLVYQPVSGNFTVNLLAGKYSYEWFNPVSNKISSAGVLTATSGSRVFTPPFPGSAVLYLAASDN